MSYIVAIAGPIAAGKSAVADRLADVLGARRRSFGGVVRERAVASGLPVDRKALQDLGEKIIVNDGWDGFCRAVVGRATMRPVVVDGVRHIGAVEGLAHVAPRGLFALVFVDSPPDVRASRLLRRDMITPGDLEAAQRHPNEGELPMVRQQATLVVNNSTEGEHALQSIVGSIVEQLEVIIGTKRA